MIEEILSQVMQTKAMCALFTDEADTDKFSALMYIVYFLPYSDTSGMNYHTVYESYIH